MQIGFVILIVVVFGSAAGADIRNERRRAAKKYESAADINAYMLNMLSNGGRCEICSRDASWIADKRIFALLEQ